MLSRELEKSGVSGVVTVRIDGQYVEVGTVAQVVAWNIEDEKARLARFRREVAKHLRAGFKETPRSRSRREFVFDDGETRKFWGVGVDGALYTAHSGRIGTRGRQQKKAFATQAAAEAARDRLIAAKLRAGYVEVKH